MHRYRVLQHDFDSRAALLSEKPDATWTEERHEDHKKRLVHITGHLAAHFGTWRIDEKVNNFREIGVAPVSLLAFHNRFFRQAREAFVAGSYYPALTGSCALGERILNHLILLLREDFRDTAEYKRVYRNDSFDDWGLAITTLQSWQVLLPETAEALRRLERLRHASIHFRPEVDTNDRALALGALAELSNVITRQFSSFGSQPWYIEGTLGACFVKREAEEDAFVKRVVLPNCRYVGYLHGLGYEGADWTVIDRSDYEDREISDEEFRDLFNNRDPSQVAQLAR